MAGEGDSGGVPAADTSRDPAGGTSRCATCPRAGAGRQAGHLAVRAAVQPRPATTTARSLRPPDDTRNVPGGPRARGRDGRRPALRTRTRGELVSLVSGHLVSARAGLAKRNMHARRP